MIAVIPARSGSVRVKNKNIKLINGHPLIAYTIEFAKKSKMFDKVICTTDSKQIGAIAKYYGCDEVVIRSKAISSTTSPDIDWINDLVKKNLLTSEYFCILRITSPIKSKIHLNSALRLLVKSKGDSVRAITKIHDHPGKAWVYLDKKKGLITPVIHSKNSTNIAFHARQYQDLPLVYVQTSSFEFIKTNSVKKNGTREGRVILGYEINYPDTINIDYEEDFDYFKYLFETGKINLIKVKNTPYSLG
jgi:CMP-N-acetylneuraminic acid synthetase